MLVPPTTRAFRHRSCLGAIGAGRGSAQSTTNAETRSARGPLLIAAWGRLNIRSLMLGLMSTEADPAIVELDKEIRQVRKALGDAGVPRKLIIAIDTRALRTGRRQTGEYQTNRASRWALVPGRLTR